MTRLSPFISDSHIIDLIHNIHGQQVMIDTDLAQVFQVETKYLNCTVKRKEKGSLSSLGFSLAKKNTKT
jgi:hypothetical protein